MKRPTLRTAVVAVLVLALGAALARAEITQKGNLRVSVTGSLSPRVLPRHGTAPVSVSVAGKISTTDKTTPPHLKRMTIEINRHGNLDSTGLPTCRMSQIRAATNSRALALCRKALVGQGKFAGTITLPGSSPFPIQGRLLAFNARERGRPVLLGHIYTPRPLATSFVIVFRIGAKAHGRYGTVLTADLARALGAKRTLTAIELTLSRRYSYRGRRHSYVNAGCPAPQGLHSISFLLARTTFDFVGGKTLQTVVPQSCGAKG